MLVTNVIDYDTVNYKVPSMFIGTNKCTGKCNGCQNKYLHGTAIEVKDETLFNIYKNNPLTRAIVLGGLEPFDSFIDVFRFIKKFREFSEDDVVIYSGYYPHELRPYISILQQFNNIIVKFGRYVPNLKSSWDDLLEVELASPNQFAVKIS